ncbi:hypothetical protein [Telluribacter sp.]|jgi:hypothetical protein|uniref:hypothetical protein n=1 Tax=Telluribacter sp. TaxID=1978767 RepID=UPI002E10CE05|nr:hypothetical protein [Telluribacter sp.]
MKKIRNVFKWSLVAVGSLALIYFSSMIIREIRVVADNQEITTQNFVVRYSGILESEGKDISEALEANYDRIREELQDPKHDRISVYIHSSQEDFNKATGLINSKANGTSRGPLTFHLKYDTWYNSVFPQDMSKVAVHEFTHCVQLNILIQDALSKTAQERLGDFDKAFEEKFQKKYPQWLWEALSDYEAGMVNKVSVKYGMKNRPTLQELNNSNQIYTIGYTIIDYFVSTYGKDKLGDFIKSYGDFDKVLGVSESDFEIDWHTFTDKKY